MITPEDIQAAAQRIAAHVRVTPVLRLEENAFESRARLTLKLESLQHAGSFKPRGAFNRILSADVPAAGVIAASGGNHGAAVAYAARSLGYDAEIFVPTITSAVKVERLRQFGAHVTIAGNAYAEALEASNQRAAATGALVVHAYDQPEVLAGQGTLAREFEEQAPGLNTVLVAVGGGGLIGGMAAWFRGRVRLIAVEPEQAPSLARALEAGAPTDVNTGGIAADSLGARRVGNLMFPFAQKFIERVVLVTDDAIRDAQRTLWREMRIAVEPGGAAAFAAILSSKYQPAMGERVGVVLWGGNVDPAQLAVSS
jgi:threonine dehydratase